MSAITSIIKQSIKRIQLGNPQFSHRALAKKLNVSHSFLSALLTEKKKWPLDLLDKVAEVLDLDELNMNQLGAAIIDDQLSELKQNSKIMKNFIKKSHSNFSNTTNALQKYAEIPQNKLNLLSHWYFVTLLDLCTCDNFQLDFKWISSRLGITAYEAEFAWNFLVTKGFVVQKNSQWIKSDKDVRIPTKSVQNLVQKHHQEMILKGISHMNENRDATAFSQRLIAGVIAATNMDNLSQCKDYLHNSAYEAAQQLSDGPCTELYQIYVMLYPITNFKK
jgi:uncharacterized protein (TIGR02147 family)